MNIIVIQIILFPVGYSRHYARQIVRELLIPYLYRTIQGLLTAAGTNKQMLSGIRLGSCYSGTRDVAFILAFGGYDRGVMFH